MSETERRTVIADAALRLIGTAGARGLTHRGVDKEAGLPPGSTSYYCRRRLELLALALRRHADLNHQQLVEQSKALASGPLTRETLVETIAAQIEWWTQAQNRQQLRARFELFLAASCEPELAAIVREQRQRFVFTMQAILSMLKTSNPQAKAVVFIALIEGLLLEQLRAENAPLSQADLRATLQDLLV